MKDIMHVLSEGLDGMQRVAEIQPTEFVQIIPT
jgi:hypothetical protein